MPSNSKVINLHPPSASEIPNPETSTYDASAHKVSIQATSVSESQVPAPAPERSVKLPSITVRLGVDRIVFLITDLQEPPELDAYAPEECQMRFHLLPGLLLTSPETKKSETQQPESRETNPHPPRQIVCPLLLGHKILSAKAQILQAAMEHENPFYGLSMFAKILELPEYLNLVPPEISARLPYNLVKELFPNEATTIKLNEAAAIRPDEAAVLKPEITMNPPKTTNPDETPIKVNFILPTGHPLPQLHRGKIVRISLSLYARAGGLALNDRSVMPINSRSRPTRIHVASLADDYYQLRGTGLTLPATSNLPTFYEDYTDMLDPTAALLARKGIGL